MVEIEQREGQSNSGLTITYIRTNIMMSTGGCYLKEDETMLPDLPIDLGYPSFALT